MSTDEAKMIVLISSDKQSFQIKQAAAVKSVTIKNIIEEDYDGCDIPIPNVTAKILAMVVEYCNRHVEEKPETEGADDLKPETEGADDLKAFDAEFVKVDQRTMFDLILAANYLNIKDLLNLMCQTLADKLNEMTPEQVRESFNLVNDFTPEEEEKIRKENAWVFE